MRSGLGRYRVHFGYGYVEIRALVYVFGTGVNISLHTVCVSSDLKA